ncbi:MAG TPA: tetratricopeptide repeat protein, partial [Polyangia bacterium]|nr:tetratricopeptide repeat protein [Polyangia bacterium]
MWVLEVLGRGLRADPAERFSSMNELLTELDRRAGTGRKGFATGAAAKLAGVWEGPVGGYPVPTPGKERMREAFIATGKPYAAAVFAGASTILDRFAQRWTELYVEVCEATHVRGEQSSEILDLRMACLDEGLEDLKALCRLFRAPTLEVVENAVNAANALGTLERCQDLKLLRAVVRLPDDPAKRAAVEAFRTRLVDARALSRVGRAVDGLAAVTPLVEEARRLAHAPTLAEVLLLYGKLQDLVQTPASATFEEAIWIAEGARHEEVAAEAAAYLVYISGYAQAHFEVGEIWSRHAETILRRMSGHELLWAFYYNSRGCMREQQGRLEDAIDDARLSIAAKERVLDPNSAEVALSLCNLANHMAYGADFAGALDVNERAVDILTATLGRDHPRTALVIGNHAQFLWRLGQIEAARVAALAALDVFQRETAGQGLGATFPMRTLGLCYQQTGRFDEAVAMLERALGIREAKHSPPLRLAEVRFPLARAVLQSGRKPARAVALARRALAEYAQTANTPTVALDRAELERWLATHALPTSPPSRKRVKKKQAPSLSTSKRRKASAVVRRR